MSDHETSLPKMAHCRTTQGKLTSRRHALRQIGAVATSAWALAHGLAAGTALAASTPMPPGSAKFTRARAYTPPPIKRKPADLVADRLVLPFSREFARGKHGSRVPSGPPGAWPGAETFSGGEEAALINNPAGEWMFGGPPDSMLLWAEGHGGLPNHWLNPATGRLWSIFDTPGVNAYWRAPTFDPQSDSPIKLDTAHYPSLCYVPYLATGDRYYLEELQFAANYHALAINPVYRQDKTTKAELGIFHLHQMRGWAWHLRDTVAAYLATPEGDLPPPLLPKSYWKRMLDNNREWILENWIRKEHARSALHMFPIGGSKANLAPWQHDWVGAVLGWMVWSGRFDDWRPIYEWQIQQALDRTSGKSGYPRSRAIFYWYKADGPTDMAGLAAQNKLTETADGKFPPRSNMHYGMSLRANLKIAVLNGVAGAKDCLAYVDPQITEIQPKWAV